MYTQGVSVFFGLKEYNLENTIAYLKKALKLGYKHVFSSAHIDEQSSDFQDLLKIIDFTIQNGMHLSLDVSKRIMDNFVIPKGLYALRLDYGFTKQEIVDFSKNKDLPLIELNASTLTKKYFESLVSLGLDIERVRFSFNYYPKMYTGHDIEFCKEMIDYLHSFNAKVLIFLPSQFSKRPPIYEGLPTIELHRKMNLNQAIEELKAIDADEIAFGDAYASVEELMTLQSHNVPHLIIDLKLYQPSFETVYSLNANYTVRVDKNSFLLRMSGTRSINEIEPINFVERKKYDLTIDNSKFLRYRGEINICLLDLPFDERVNVIGSLRLTSTIVDKIKTGYPISFNIVK